LVCSLPSEAADLIGTDFMNETGAMIDFECKRMSLADFDKMTQAHSLFPIGRTTLKFLPRVKDTALNPVEKRRGVNMNSS